MTEKQLELKKENETKKKELAAAALKKKEEKEERRLEAAQEYADHLPESTLHLQDPFYATEAIDDADFEAHPADLLKKCFGQLGVDVRHIQHDCVLEFPTNYSTTETKDDCGNVVAEEERKIFYTVYDELQKEVTVDQIVSGQVKQFEEEVTENDAGVAVSKLFTTQRQQSRKEEYPSVLRDALLNAVQINATCNLKVTKKMSADKQSVFVLIAAPDWDDDYDVAWHGAVEEWRSSLGLTTEEEAKEEAKEEGNEGLHWKDFMDEESYPTTDEDFEDIDALLVEALSQVHLFFSPSLLHSSC